MRLNESTRLVASGLRAALDLLLPSVCRLCNEPVYPNRDFCLPCERSLSLSATVMSDSCRRCGMPGALPARPRTASPVESACGSARLPDRDACVHCRSKKFRFEGVTALWIYRDLVRDAVVAAKYSHHAPLADALGRRLGERLLETSHADPAELVTVVPSHLIRQISRGGNGVGNLGVAVASVIGRPLRPLLQTTRQIHKQAWLGDADRAGNVCGAFAIKKSYAFWRCPAITGRHILVVDDVLTSGATANEIAGVLLTAGARRVSLAVVARATRTQ